MMERQYGNQEKLKDNISKKDEMIQRRKEELESKLT